MKIPDVQLSTEYSETHDQHGYGSDLTFYYFNVTDVPSLKCTLMKKGNAVFSIQLGI
jgi:hypothetical protein